MSSSIMAMTNEPPERKVARDLMLEYQGDMHLALGRCSYEQYTDWDGGRKDFWERVKIALGRMISTEGR